MLTLFQAPLLSTEGKDALLKMQSDLVVLQGEHPGNDIIAALIKLIDKVKDATAGLVDQQDVKTKEIADLVAVIDGYTGVCIPMVRNQATLQIADIFFKHGRCFQLQAKEKYLEGMNSTINKLARPPIINYSISKIISLIVRNYELERRLYVATCEYETKRHQQLINGLDACFGVSDKHQEEGKYQQIAQEFLSKIGDVNRLIVERKLSSTVYRRGMAHLFRVALHLEYIYLSNGNIPLEAAHIYPAVKEICQGAKVEAYVKECAAACKLFEDKLRAYLKSGPKSEKVAAAENMLTTLRLCNDSTQDTFSMLADVERDLSDIIPKLSMGRLFKLLLEMRLQIITLMEACGADCDPGLFHESKRFEKRFEALMELPRYCVC